MLYVHGDIRHLENHYFVEVVRKRVHGDIRHLEMAVWNLE